VSSELEQSHDADDAEELEDVVILFHVRQHAVEVERQRRDEVYDVDRCPGELQLAGTDDRPRYQLERKPRVTDALDIEERVVRQRALLVEQPRQGLGDP